MANRFVSLATAVLVAGATGTSLYTASTAQDARTAISAAQHVTTTHGDLAVHQDAGLARLAVGVTGQVLTVSGGGLPAWAAPAVTASQISDGTSAGRTLLTAASAAAQRTALQAPRVVTYSLSDFTPEAGSESLPADQGGGVWRFSVSAAFRFYGGSYTYDGVTYAERSAPRMRLTLPAGTWRVDARLRIAAHTGASSWEMPVMLLESGSTLLHGVGCFATGETNDVRGGAFTSTYPTTGTAPSTALAWSGNDWLRLVWDSGVLAVYTSEGTGSAEPTTWEVHSALHFPAGRVAPPGDLVIAATRPSSATSSAVGASGTLASWTVDVAALVTAWVTP